MNNPERRLVALSISLAVGGTLLAWFGFGVKAGVSFLAGAVLSGVDLLWLRSTIGSILLRDPKRRKSKLLLGFFLRLLLIPLGLYAMIRFLFLDVVAAVAGLGIFVCSVLVEGILEAFGSSPR